MTPSPSQCLGPGHAEATDFLSDPRPRARLFPAPVHAAEGAERQAALAEAGSVPLQGEAEPPRLHASVQGTVGQ